MKKDFVGTISGYDFDSEDSTITIHREINSIMPDGLFEIDFKGWMDGRPYILTFVKSWDVSHKSNDIQFGKEDLLSLRESHSNERATNDELDSAFYFFKDNWEKLPQVRFVQITYYSKSEISTSRMPSFALTEVAGIGSLLSSFYFIEGRPAENSTIRSRYHLLDIKTYRDWIEKGLVESGDNLIYPKGQTPKVHVIADLEDAEAYFYY